MYIFYAASVLTNYVKQRKYFDSGDFALAAAGKVTDNGAIRPGTVHPLRKSISRPHAPVPDRCNVNEGANENIHDKKSGSTDMTDSPLRQQTDKIEKTKRPREES